MSFVTSLAGVASAQAVGAEASAQTPAPKAPGWDLRWLDEFRGRHKQVYDLGGVDLDQDPRPLRFARNYLDTFSDVYALEFPDVNTAVGISNSAFPMNASDRLWEKYRLGERAKIIDPTTMKPAVRNVFLDGSPLSVKAMQARGTVFWQCNVALGVIAQQLSQVMKMPVDEVRADLLAGLNPGVRLVPAHVMALGLAQERGFTYVKA
jgi:hypothetical protein